MGLFVAGALIYANARAMLGPLLAISVALVAFAAVRSIYWPESVTLRFALEFSYRILTFGAAVRLLRYRRARREIGPWLLAAGLLLLHLDWPPITSHLPPGAGVFLDMLLGLGMLLVILDESRLHSRRLATLNEMATAVAHAAQNGPMAATALQQLKDLMRADAAWFRFINGQRLTIFQHIGLSAEFMEDRASVDIDDPVERIPAETRPILVSATQLRAQPGAFATERLKQLVVVAVPGRKALVGTLVLANRHVKSYSPDEMDFLVTCAPAAWAGAGKSASGGRNSALPSAVEQYLRIDSGLGVTARRRLSHSESQPVTAGAAGEIAVRCCGPALRSRVAKTRPRLGRIVPTAMARKTASTKGPTRSADSPSLRPPPMWTREPSRRATIHVVRDITERRAAEQNIVHCSSRCRKAYSSPLLKANCSTATTLSFACWATAAAKKSWS